MMTYKEILSMVSDTTYTAFYKGLNYEGMQKTIVECATEIYIAQMQLEKEKLQEEYDDLCEGHDKLSYEWAKLKKENKELRDYYDDMRKNYNELVIKFDNLYSELYEEGYIEDD